jgi:two-component system phosphate regulon response regulator PhoB
MLTARILVLDQDKNARTQTSRELRLAGHNVDHADDLREALRALNGSAYDLLLLDVTADRQRAMELLRDLKSSQRIAPIRVIVTSGHGHDAATVLRAGADDFIAKPVAADELIARIEVAQRRNPIFGPDASIVRAGALSIDDASHRVTVDGEPLKTSPREYQLLRFFAGNPSRVYTREQLLGFVWRQSQRLGSRTVDVHVRRLRGLLEPHGCDHYLETVRGAGYRFDPERVTKLSH